MKEIIITSIITALATAIISNIAYYFKEKKLLKKKNQLELCGKIMGNIQLLRQLYVNKFEDEIDSNFYNQMCLINPNNKHYDIEANRLNNESRELSIETAKARKDFFTEIYKIEALFDLDETAKTDLDKLILHKTPMVKNLPANLSEKQLAKIADSAKRELHRLIDEELYQPCKKLYDDLKKLSKF